MIDGPYGEIARRLRRAVRNGTRLRLEPEHAKALMEPRIYVVLAEAEGEEIRQVGASSASRQTPPSARSPPGLLIKVALTFSCATAAGQWNPHSGGAVDSASTKAQILATLGAEP